GRMYNFWGDEMLAKRLNDIEKNASTRIRGFQSQHTSVANRILTERNNTLGSNPFNLRNNNGINSSDKVKRSQGNERSSCKDNVKRKREDNEMDYEGLSLLFDELNEDALVESIDENILDQENLLPKANGMMTEEELKMSTTFPLFRGIFTSDKIKIAWGEIQALPTKYARNEKENPFKRARVGRRVDMKSTLIKTSPKFEVIYGEVSGGLGPHGIPTACRLEINFYAMDWSGVGIYRFGLIDQCRLPSDDDEFGILEDAFCILKLLECQYKSLEIEKVVKQLFLENTKGKRRQITSEIEAELNENRSPER
ncbi:5175_t:CDS:2, partial [Cetraspora pellucida]